MVFVAEFIHQAQRLCLFSAEHPSIGEALHRLQIKVSPLRHNPNELAIAAVDQLLKQRPFGIAQRTIRGKDVLERTALHRVEANPDLFEHPREVVAPQDHPDGTGDRAGIGDDFLRSHADVDASGGGDVAEAGHHATALFPESQQGCMNFLAVSNRAAGAVNAQQQRWKFPLLHLPQRFQHPLPRGTQ